MALRIKMVIVLAFLAQFALSQNKLAVITAKTNKVDIRTDGKLQKNAWRIVPAEKLDVYKTNAKNVSFITDSDSISFKIQPNKVYDFTILLGKDSAKTRIQFEPSRLDILKNAGKYNFSDNREVPVFTYQDMNNSDLQRVRKDLKLDSIAGKGNELSQIFNLMHWVHNIVRHDGGSENPTLKNAIDLVKVCKAENRGVNCRMMATILNECYLSMGIKSRYITCMPKETEFDDCHVINMVYSNQLKKWIWMDPTFDAYVMDGNGNLLGIEQVRERLINDQPLVLNADANWNRENLQTKEGYLKNYMAKNLYRLQTPLYSQYDSETWKAGKEVAYVELLPLDGLVQEPQKKVSTNNKNGVTFTYYKTNNPSKFWLKP